MDPGCTLSFDELVEYNLNVIKITREEKINDSFVFNDWTFDCDDRARANITGAATLALGSAQKGGMDAEFTWRDADNVDRSMPGYSIIQLGAALFTHVATCYYVYRAHKANILAISDYDELVKYDSRTGWPK